MTARLDLGKNWKFEDFTTFDKPLDASLVMEGDQSVFLIPYGAFGQTLKLRVYDYDKKDGIITASYRFTESPDQEERIILRITKASKKQRLELKGSPEGYCSCKTWTLTQVDK